MCIIYSWVGNCASISFKRHTEGNTLPPRQSWPEEHRHQETLKKTNSPPPHWQRKYIQSYGKQNWSTSVHSLMSRWICLNSYWRLSDGKYKATRMILIQFVGSPNAPEGSPSTTHCKRITIEAWTAGTVKHFGLVILVGLDRVSFFKVVLVLKFGNCYIRLYLTHKIYGPVLFNLPVPRQLQYSPKMREHSLIWRGLQGWLLPFYKMQLMPHWHSLLRDGKLDRIGP